MRWTFIESHDLAGELKQEAAEAAICSRTQPVQLHLIPQGRTTVRLLETHNSYLHTAMHSVAVKSLVAKRNTSKHYAE